MSLKSVIDLFAQTTGTDIKALRAADQALIDTRGVMADLSTTHKTTLVGALNELKTATDSALTSGQVSALISTAIDGLIDGAPGTFDTLKEIADYIAADQTAATAITEALGKRLRFDAPQVLDATQQAQGQANLHVPSKEAYDVFEAGVGDYANANPNAVYIAARDAA